MLNCVSSLARLLTEISVRRPLATAAVGLVLTLGLAFQAAQLTSEVGYAAYFGPDDPAVHRLSNFFEEFDSGLHVLVVFGCPGSNVCSSIQDRSALEFIAELQRELDRLSNVRRTQSVLNAPIVVGPLETRTIAERNGQGEYSLAADWENLATRSLGEPFLANVVVSQDGKTAGIIVEFQSLDSEPVRDLVHAILDLTPKYEEALGSEIFVAGDPVWTVVADDDLDADSLNLTVLMFVLITAILWGFFRAHRFLRSMVASGRALPMTLSIGMGPKYRLSQLRSRLDPTTHNSPSRTVRGPNATCSSSRPRVSEVRISLWSISRPFTASEPRRRSTWSPGSARICLRIGLLPSGQSPAGR